METTAHLFYISLWKWNRRRLMWLRWKLR